MTDDADNAAPVEDADPPEKSVEHLDTESQLQDALGEWSKYKPEDDPENTELREIEGKIAKLEGEKADWTKERGRYESERGDFEAAVHENTALAQEAREFHDRVRAEADRRDADKFVADMADETGIDPRVIDSELKMKLLSDPEFREAAENRANDPDAFNALVQNFQDDVAEKFPPTRDDKGLAAAVHLAGSVVSVSRDNDEHSEIDWPRLSTADFSRKAKEVLDAAKKGKLKSSRARGGGFFTTSPK